MKIGSYFSPTISSQSTKSAAAAMSLSAGNATVPASGFESIEKAKEIMQRYNLHDLSYADLTKLGMELEQAGVIPKGHLIEYVPPPQGQFKMEGGNLVFDGSGKHDFMQNLQDHLAYAEKYQASDFSTIFHIRRMVDFYYNLDGLRKEPPANASV